MGVGGTAAATVVAQAVSGVLAGVYVYRSYPDMLPAKEDFRLEKELTKEMLAAGGAMGLMYSVVDLGSVVFQGAANALGETYIAAHTAARRIINILMQPMSGMMNASGTFVGQNWGAKRKRRIRDTLKKTWGYRSPGVCFPA